MAKTALVTGAARGIGLAIASRLAADGARVAVLDLDAEGAEAAARTVGGDAIALVADVTKAADVDAAVSRVVDAWGRLDILVNNAGVDCTGAVETLELSAWRRIMSINVDGVFLGTKTFTKLLAETGRGTRFGANIINISSIMGMVGYSEASAYNAGKGAVRLFTKAVAIEFAQKRTPIRVNSIHPGFVKTPLLASGMQKWVDRGLAEKAQDLIDALAAATPNGRLAEPAEIAGAAYFLASDDSSYCTGSELVIDGGWTAQ